MDVAPNVSWQWAAWVLTIRGGALEVAGGQPMVIFPLWRFATPRTVPSRFEKAVRNVRCRLGWQSQTQHGIEVREASRRGVTNVR